MKLSFRSAIVLLVFSALHTNAQDVKTKNFYESIKKYDLSKLWKSDSLLIIEREENLKGERIIYKTWNDVFPEPLGFIGNDFQRFYIHYISVSRSSSNPYQYFVTGKTKVKDNICSFSGIIVVKKAELYIEQDFQDYKQGTITCYCKFYEDSTKPFSGYISGELKSEWYLDKHQHIFYDDLDMIGDGYRNNQFTGTWESYKINAIKKCNWGDYRIPGSSGLDLGVSEFSVDDKFLKNGWQNYASSLNGTDTLQQAKAKEVESVKWWK